MTNIVKKNDNKWIYPDYGKTFHRKGEWSLGNGFARNVVIFGADISSSSHSDNRNKTFE